MNGKGSPEASFRSCITSYSETKFSQQEAEDCLQVTSLANLFVLDCTNLPVHFRVGESEVSNRLADAVTCGTYSRLVGPVGPIPII